jgi:hypothetical protein
MIKHSLIKQFLPVIILSVSLLFVGCEKKAEESKQTQEVVNGENVSPDTSASVPSESEPVENKIQIPDIKGTWSGKFDERATTLTITEQTDSSFSGKITINYREVINQDVKGTFSPASLKMNMTDQLHSRYQGSYSGQLSKELNNFSGTFTMKVDGSKFSFNLNKK